MGYCHPFYVQLLARASVLPSLADYYEMLDDGIASMLRLMAMAMAMTIPILR